MAWEQDFERISGSPLSLSNVSTIWPVAVSMLFKRLKVDLPSSRKRHQTIKLSVQPTVVLAPCIHNMFLLASNSSPNMKAHELSKVRTVSHTPASVVKRRLSTSFLHPHPNLTLILSSRLQFIHIPPSQVRLPTSSSGPSTYNRKRMNSHTQLPNLSPHPLLKPS